MSTGGTSYGDLQLILYQALNARIGLVLRSNDPIRARNKLYNARQKAGDPALSVIQIRLSPSHPDELLLTKGESHKTDAAK